MLLALLLALGICLVIGCSDDTTGPEDQPMSTPEHLWSQRFGDGTIQDARAVAVDLSGDVVLAGYFEGTVDCGGGALTSAGMGDILVAKFAPDGTHLWSKRFGDATEQIIEAVAVDGSGNVIVAGWFLGTIDFGGGALTSAGSYDIFVAKLGPDGTHLWSQRFGNSQSQTVSALAVDGSGNVIAAGSFFGTVDFGGGALTCAGEQDIFVAKFGP